MSGLDEQRATDRRAAVRIRDCAEDLSAYLASWQAESRPGRRQALNEAVRALDLILRAVYDLRHALVTQARQFDDETAARTDELLKRCSEDKLTGGES